MKISIIIPVYNKAEYLDRCFESIFRQSFADFEVLAVEDGSTDDSAAVCDQWAEREPRLRVFHKDNGGVTAARRYGLERSEGQYIMFVDADDRLADDALQHLYNTVKQYRADEVIAPFVTHTGVASPVVYESWVNPDVLIRDIVAGRNRFPVLWSILFRKEILQNALNLPRDIIEGEDKLMQVKVLMQHPTIYFTTHPAYVYTIGLPNSRRHTLQREILYDRLLRQVLFPRKEEFRTVFVLHQLREYEQFILDGEFSVRKDYYKKAIGTLPVGISCYHRLVYMLPPVLARPVIRLYRQLINLKQKGL